MVAQTQTGSATAQGSCNIANTGSGSTVSLTCNAISNTLALQLRQLVNISKRDVATLNDLLGKLDALDASIEATRTDQRAWVGLIAIDTLGGNDQPDKFTFDRLILAIQNSGKTPAINLGWECCRYLERQLNDPIPDYDDIQAQAQALSERLGRNSESIRRLREQFQAELPKGVVIPPNATRKITVSPGRMSFDKSKSEFGTSLSRIYVLGKFTYNDIFEETARRTTKFCLVQAGNNFYFCQAGNSMD
jgi:hypothetical protein